MYSYITPNDKVINLKTHIKQPIEEWKNMFFNDFEKVIFERHKEVAEVKQFLYNSGALYSAMSGSGSSVFGLFSKDFDCNSIVYENSFIWKSKLANSNL
jgi:4-diphosphocytidyl-2-C-methyl-D-erythritol kinase